MCGQCGVDAVGDDRLLERHASASCGTKWSAKPIAMASAPENGAPVSAACRPEQARRTRQDERAADVGDEADADLGHRHLRGVGDDPDAAVDADPDAAAHHDAVHQRDVGLAEAADLRVEQILVVPELPGFRPVGAGAVVDRDDVAACAQSAFAGPVDHDGADVVVVLPVGQDPRDRVDHRVGQRVDRLGPVEGDQADTAVDGY